jgi:hypothetical protein
MFSENLGLPRWIFWLAFSLLVMGLPVVMAISLAKEEVYGDEVPAEHAEAAAAEDRRLRFLTWRTAGFAFVGMVAMWGVIFRVRRHGGHVGCDFHRLGLAGRSFVPAIHGCRRRFRGGGGLHRRGGVRDRD